MTERTTTLRLRRVRFKDGRTIEVFRNREREAVYADAVGRLSRSADSCIGGLAARGLVGYALVAWAADGEVFTAYHNSETSMVPAGRVPSYVHDCLLAEQAVRWSRDD